MQTRTWILYNGMVSAARADKAVGEKERVVIIGGGVGGVDNKAREENGHASFFGF